MLMDRLIGLMGLIIISSVIIGVQYHWLKMYTVTRNLTWVFLLILVSSLGGIAFSFVISGFGLAHKLPKRMPMRDRLIELADAYNAFAKAWPASLVALVASFGVHIASFSVFICAARALNVVVPSGGAISTGALLTVMPIILTLAAMPVSVGGTGVREALFAMLLWPLCGVTQPVAATLGLTGFMLSAAWGIGGGDISVYRPSEHAKLARWNGRCTNRTRNGGDGGGGGGEENGKGSNRRLTQIAMPGERGPRGMKMGENRGWTLMDTDIPDTCQRFLSICGSNFRDRFLRRIYHGM